MITEDLISEKLRGLRAEKRLSQEQVAEKMGIHRETFRKYEKNPLLMSTGLFIEMLMVYNTNPLIFFKSIMAKCQEK